LGGFAITVKKEGQICHYAIQHTQDIFKIGKESAPSLVDLIRATAKRLGLIYPCTGGPFDKTFKTIQQQMHNYSTFNE
jgi:hypothetical protein